MHSHRTVEQLKSRCEKQIRYLDRKRFFDERYHGDARDVQRQVSWKRFNVQIASPRDLRSKVQRPIESVQRPTKRPIPASIKITEWDEEGNLIVRH